MSYISSIRSQESRGPASRQDSQGLYRPARRSDAWALADLIVLASGGLSLLAWAELAAPGEAPLDVGRRRAARDEGAFSWRNAHVVDEGQGAVAGLVGYALPAEPGPMPRSLPSRFVPLHELENEACGTWYVNALATYPTHQKRGFGSRLLGFAEEQMQLAGRRGLSLIASDRNEVALRLYRRQGFVLRSARPAAGASTATWLLLTRDA